MCDPALKTGKGHPNQQNHKYLQINQSVRPVQKKLLLDSDIPSWGEFQFTDIEKINLSDIYECKSIYRICDRDFHLKSIIIKYNENYVYQSVKFDKRCEDLLQNPKMQEMLNHIIDTKLNKTSTVKIEIRHLKEWENIINKINQLKTQGE